ncbi:unnamed protein product [Dicrocoelium dendriticum]|nr:unnamed protein product [Dicrocoelium dendriticum]
MNLRSPADREARPTTEITVNRSQPLILRAQTEALQGTPEQSTSSHGIRWLEGTVDNEFLGRKKSNCCCIYKKPHRWDESSSSSSSSSSDDDNDRGEDKNVRHIRSTEHCRGHTRHCYQNKRREGGKDGQTAVNTDPSIPGSAAAVATDSHKVSEPPVKHTSVDNLK